MFYHIFHLKFNPNYIKIISLPNTVMLIQVTFLSMCMCLIPLSRKFACRILSNHSLFFKEELPFFQPKMPNALIFLKYLSNYITFSPIYQIHFPPQTSKTFSLCIGPKKGQVLGSCLFYFNYKENFKKFWWGIIKYW